MSTETENSIDMMKGCFRTPTLVTILGEEPSSGSGFGYDLPIGWGRAGTGESHSFSCPVSLNAGETTFVPIDFFRPATVNTAHKELFSTTECAEQDLADFSLCKTDYYLTVRYQQERSPAIKPKVIKRAIRRRPQMGSAAKSSMDDSVHQMDTTNNDSCVNGEDSTDNYDEVSLERTGTLVWATPLSATFYPGTKLEYSSGSRHELNVVGKGTQGERQEDLLLKDGECTITQCSIQLDGAMDGIDTKIVSVRFEVSSNVDFIFLVITSFQSLMCPFYYRMSWIQHHQLHFHYFRVICHLLLRIQFTVL
jgi:hypothetical protein